MCYFASILFGESVFKKKHRLSVRARANNVNSTKASQMLLFDWINEKTSDKRSQAKFYKFSVSASC